MGKREDEIDRLTRDREALLEACKFVKAFFQKLEDDTYDDDPLLKMRQRFHAPIHAKLDAAIATAEAPQEEKQ
jgi:hypothetical protein